MKPAQEVQYNTVLNGPRARRAAFTPLHHSQSRRSTDPSSPVWTLKRTEVRAPRTESSCTASQGGLRTDWLIRPRIHRCRPQNETGRSAARLMLHAPSPVRIHSLLRGEAARLNSLGKPARWWNPSAYYSTLRAARFGFGATVQSSAISTQDGGFWRILAVFVALFFARHA